MQQFDDISMNEDDDTLPVCRINPLSVLTLSTAFHYKERVQKIAFINTYIPGDVIESIERKTERFLLSHLTGDKDIVESIIAGNANEDIFFRDAIGTDFQIVISRENARTQFEFEGIGIAVLRDNNPFSVTMAGFEFCTGIFLYNKTRNFCLVAHLPIVEAHVVDCVDNILCHLFDTLNYNIGINLSQSKLFICCGDDSNNSKKTVFERNVLSGELVYKRIVEKCKHRFLSIEFNKNYIVSSGTEVTFDTSQESLLIDKQILPSDNRSISQLFDSETNDKPAQLRG